MADIDNMQDVLDVRDIIARVEELREELTDAKDGRSEQEAEQELPEWLDTVMQEEGFPLMEAAEELQKLESLLSDLAGNGGGEQWRGDWYPVTLIRDSYFETYAQELADDIGAIDSKAGWPNNCIDWERAARELQQDYSSVEYDGVTYWYR